MTLMTSISPLAPAPASGGRLPSCPRCSARRWAVSERGTLLPGWCLQCGLGAGDILAPGSGFDPGLRWVAHAGLGAGRPANAPDHDSLDRALRLGVDAVELDVCATADARLVAWHDVRLGRRLRVDHLTLAELRRRHPATLTLSQAVEQVRGRTQVLVDVKHAAATRPLIGWLRRQRHTDDLAVCAPSRPDLERLRRRVPRVARWQTLPALGATPARGTAHVVWNLLGQSVRGRPFYVGSELVRAGVLAVDCPRRAARHLVGSPWRRLPSQLRRLTAETAPAGLCVDHRLLSAELLDAAARRGLEVIAWTINSPDALREVVERGVRTVTTDDVVGMRLASARLRQPRPG